MTPIEGLITQHRRERIIASPRARRAMRLRGIDPSFLAGSGPGGRIVEADVLRAAGAGSERIRAEQKTRARTGAIAADRRFALRATADATSLVEIIKHLADEVQQRCGTPLRFSDLVLRAVALALADCPRANCSWQAENCVEQSTADVGFEVEGPGGRLTPVIHRADRLSLLELVRQRAELAAAACAGRLPPSGATQAATSLVDLTEQPVDECTAALQLPQTSILAAGRVALRPAAFGNRLCLRQTVCLNLTVDARAVSPEAAAALLGRIVELVENPFLLLCERLGA